MKKVNIFDTTLRDGEQGIGYLMTNSQKIAILIAVDRLSLDVIELGMPYSSQCQQELFSQVAEISPNSRICSLSRINKDEVLLNCELLNKFSNSRIQLLGVGSEFHLHNKLKFSRSELFQRYNLAIELLKDHYKGELSIILEDASRGSFEFLCYQIEYLLSRGVNKIALADTLGCLTPSEVQIFISKIRALFGKDLFISVHFHNDLGLATANAITAILAGADEVQGAFIGAGERCGNMSIEELCAIITLKDNINRDYYVGVDLKELVQTCYKILDILNLDIPLYKPIIGKYAFATAAGIHQDGIKKHRLNYSFFDPQVIGRNFEFIRNRLSSKKNIAGETLIE